MRRNKGFYALVLPRLDADIGHPATPAQDHSARIGILRFARAQIVDAEIHGLRLRCKRAVPVLADPFERRDPSQRSDRGDL